MRPFLPILAVLALVPGAAHATDLVVFEDGRGIRVKAFNVAEGSALLTLEDGSQLGVPSRSIMTIERAVDPEDPQPVEAAHAPAETQALAADLAAQESWRRAAGRHAE